MATPVFTEAEYADPPRTGLETNEADGTWLGCTAYTHATRGNVVLWYGGETHEGLCGGYRWGAGVGAGGSLVPGSGDAPVLLDGDGDVVPTRWARRRGGWRVQGQQQGGKDPRVPDPAAAAAAPRLAERFLPFEGALAVARSLGLAGMSGRMEWKVWCKAGGCPPNVPRRPDYVYNDAGWQGWGHWLGTGNQCTKEFLPFGEALAVARSLGLASLRAWHAWCKEGMRPPDVPSAPNVVYKDHGWQGWGHWLGTGNTRNMTHFLPFGEALAVAQSLGLASMFEWRVWSKEGLRPTNVPSNPNTVYKDHGWQGWGHWLGTGNQLTKEFLPFDEALPMARSFGLAGMASAKEWQVWCKEGMRPHNVPAAPDKVYKDHGW